MRQMLTMDWVEIPSDVTATVNARKVSIKGKRGTVTKDFSHVACELKKMKQDNKKRTGDFIRIRIWFGGYKQACSVNTLKSHISNMITGVTEVSFIRIGRSPPSEAVNNTSRVWCVFYNCVSLSFGVLINNYTECRASATR